MNLRKYSDLLTFGGGSASGEVKHPMLLDGAGIATIAAACTTAANALILSVVMLVLCLTMGLIYIFERNEYIQPMRSIVYFVPAAFLACVGGIVVNYFSATTAARLGMYLPLTAADALVLARVRPDSPFVSPSDALPEGIRLWWLYAVMALPIGLLREMAGSGTVFGFPFFIRLNAEGMSLPFAGFIMLGFGLAIYNRISQDNQNKAAKNR